MNLEFVWFLGVVEDRLDPEKLGRVKVRILGKHTDNKDYIPTEDLPWAWPMNSINSASVSGVGQTPLGIVEGSWVVGFFRDGNDCQDPVIMGSLPGIPEIYPYPINQKTGFFDPRKDLSRKPRKIKKKEYPNDGNGARLEEEIPSPPDGQLFPKRTNPFSNVLDEPDTNRLARNDKIEDTIVAIKRSNLDTNIPIAEGNPWSEPTTPYDSSYPYNHVLESESGHIFEFDDTRGVERLHTYHRSGTFSEVYPDGVKVEKIVGNNYKIVLEEQYEHIQNRYNLTIDGPFNVIVQNNANIIIKGNCKVSVGGNLNVNVGGNYNVNVDGSYSLSAQGGIDLRTSGSASLRGSSTLIGAAGTVNLRGAAVISNPAINQALQSLVAAGLSIVRPVQPSPQITTVSPVNPPKDTLIRSYPRPIGPYNAVKEE